MQLIVAEKPSVARDLARVLGVPARGKTAFEGPERVITWCVGHLVELDEPAAYDPRWKHWRLDTLPMLPERFKLRPSTSAPEQYRAVRQLLCDRRFAEVVNACDAGREGELIFRYVYDLAGSRLPIRRLWVSSLTDEAVGRAMAALRPGRAMEPLADAARCRSEADWLVGMNATRAVTARNRTGREGQLYSIGRVQTPTLALLVARESAIRAFIPRDYWEVRAALTTNAGERFSATWTHEKHTRLAADALAQAVVARASAHGRAADPEGPRVERVAKKVSREPAPLLFDLTSLQRTANRRFGLSAARTLEVAQALYETHKVLTYPRTDSRHLTQDMARELPKLFGALAGVSEYKAFADPLLASPPKPGRRVFDDSRVSDHHAIVPTGKAVNVEALDRDERRVFDLVARRFLGVFYPDAEFALTDVVVRVGRPDGAGARPEALTPEGEDAVLTALPAPPDRFHARGRVRLVAGWQAVAGIEGGEESPADRGGERRESDAAQTLPALREGDALDGAFEPLAKKTLPPHRYTEATLLSAMESAGRAIDDEALRLAMRDCGLGTPATRAAVIETLLKRAFVTRDKKNIVPTPTGMALVANLPVASLASPELTGEWEARLARIARGEDTRAAFMADIAKYVREMVETVRATPPTLAQAERDADRDAPPGATVGRCPRCGASVVERGRAYACAASATPCAFEIPKVIAHRAISADLARVLLSHRKTQVLRGFRSRAGKAFASALTVDDAGAVRFGFANAATAVSGASGTGDGVEPPAVRPRPTRASPQPVRPAVERGAVPVARVRAAAAPAQTATGAVEARDDAEAPLRCPRCSAGDLVTGRRGWGCARWREGCTFVVWFEAAGKRVTPVQLRELITRGKTRKGKWNPGNGPPVAGRLVLDVAAPEGGARFEPG